MAGGTAGTLWVKIMVAGCVGVAAAMALEHFEAGPHWLTATLLALGGLAVVFGSCEAMIKCVEGVAQRMRLNKFVAGTMAGLASNIPELVMLGFVIAKEPRVGFIVVAFTLHVGAMTFGVYSALLPRDKSGQAKLPEPLVKLSTDLYAGAGGVFMVTGLLMVLMYLFGEGSDRKVALNSIDLYVIGIALLVVQVVAVTRLVKRFSGSTEDDADTTDTVAEHPTTAPSVSSIVGYGVLGIVTAVIGGHAVGEFADILVNSLTAAGYSEMLGAEPPPIPSNAAHLTPWTKSNFLAAGASDPMDEKQFPSSMGLSRPLSRRKRRRRRLRSKELHVASARHYRYHASNVAFSL